MSYSRISRISEEMKRELSESIRALKDPRLPLMTSVVAVDVTRDLRYAKVYVSVYGDEEAKRGAMAALKSAAGFLRREMAQNVVLRRAPELIFVADNSIEHGARINAILHDVLPETGEDDNG